MTSAKHSWPLVILLALLSISQPCLKFCTCLLMEAEQIPPRNICVMSHGQFALRCSQTLVFPLQPQEGCQESCRLYWEQKSPPSFQRVALECTTINLFMFGPTAKLFSTGYRTCSHRRIFLLHHVKKIMTCGRHCTPWCLEPRQWVYFKEFWRSLLTKHPWNTLPWLTAGPLRGMKQQTQLLPRHEHCCQQQWYMHTGDCKLRVSKGMWLARLCTSSLLQ